MSQTRRCEYQAPHGEQCGEPVDASRRARSEHPSASDPVLCDWHRGTLNDGTDVGKLVVDRLQRGLMTAGAKLDGVICTGVNLRKADLRGSTLRQTDLTGTNLTSAGLSAADLTGATIEGTNLTLATATNATFRLVKGHRAFLMGADLQEVDFSEANLSDADLTGADIQDSNLRNVALSGANLTGADLRGANLEGATLIDTDLTGADLNGVDFRSTNLLGARLWRADLSGANLSDVNLRTTDLREANLSGANLSGADLSGARLSGAQLGDADLSNVQFSSRTMLDRLDNLQSAVGISSELQAAIEAQASDAPMSQPPRKDVLTAFLNERTFKKSLIEEYRRSSRYQRPFSLTVAEIDGLNDERQTKGDGHADTALREVAKLLQVYTREVDVLGRLKGDRLSLLLPETDADGGITVASKLCELVRSPGHSLSVGVATYQAEEDGPDARGSRPEKRSVEESAALVLETVIAACEAAGERGGNQYVTADLR